MLPLDPKISSRPLLRHMTVAAKVGSPYLQRAARYRRQTAVLLSSESAILFYTRTVTSLQAWWSQSAQFRLAARQWSKACSNSCTRAWSTSSWLCKWLEHITTCNITSRSLHLVQALRARCSSVVSISTIGYLAHEGLTHPFVWSEPAADLSGTALNFDKVCWQLASSLQKDTALGIVQVAWDGECLVWLFREASIPALAFQA